MRHTSNGSRCRTSILIALAAIGMAYTSANGAVTVIGTQYQQDDVMPEYVCYWHDDCHNDYPGVNAHVYLKNTGGSSIAVTDVTLAGYSLATVLKYNSFHNTRSIYYYWDTPPAAIINAGEPLWYRADPKTIPAGGVGQVIVRLKWVPVTQPISLGVVTTAGTVSATVPVSSTDPQLPSVGFSPDRKKVYLTWRRSGGAAPTTIKMDDSDVTAYATTVGDANVNFATSVLSFSTAITDKSYHVYQGVYSDGKTATASLRTWANPFIHGSWGNREYDGCDMYGVVNSSIDHSVNAMIVNGSGCITGLTGNQSGRDWLASKGFEFVIDYLNKWSITTPLMFFLNDEPDAEESLAANSWCGTGLKIPCGINPMGMMVQELVAMGENWRATSPNSLLTVNLDGAFRPTNYYVWGQSVDVLLADPYYQRRLTDSYWRDQEDIYLFEQATYIYAVSKAMARAAEPNPSMIALFSCEWKCINENYCDEAYYGQIWPFPDPDCKRIEAYYSLAAGSKGLAYWWWNAGWPSNGLNDWGPEAQALWKEIGRYGNEAKTIAPQLTASHPVDITLTPSTNVWARAAVHGTDTLILYAVNDNYYSDTAGFHHTDVANASVVVSLPSWMTSSPTAFEVRASGLYDVTTSLNGSNLTVQLGTLDITKMILITTNSDLRTQVQSRYVSEIWPHVCNFSSDDCTSQSSAPAISQQPSSLSAGIGDTVQFTVVAAGSAPLYYQWKKDGTNLTNGGNISGATSATLQLTSVQVSDAGSFTCYVSNSYGNTTSNAATLSVSATNKCLTNADAEDGFSLQGGGYIADGWTEWESAAGATVGYEESVTKHGGSHAQRIRVWNSGGGSGGCYQRMPANTSTQYTVTAYISSGVDGLNCYLGVDPNGGTSPTSGNITWSSAANTVAWTQKSVTTTSTATYITVFYKVVAPDSNKANGYFDDATPYCTAVSAPSITQQPSNQIVGLGGSVNFSVTAEGTPTLTYQWKKDGANVSGATSATLQISNAQLSDEGSYTCYVANDYGNVTSNAATLTVTTSGNLVNANFETGTAGNPPTGWTTYIQASKSGNWTIQTAGSQEGTQWQQTQVYNTGSYGGVRQVVTGLASGTVYTVTGFYKTNSVSATASVRYNLAGNTDRANSTVLLSTTNTSWSSFSGNVTATGASMMLFLDNLNGAASNKASGFDNLRVASMPVVTQQPAPASVCAGANVNFTVAATGGGTLTYQWQKNSVNQANGGHYSGCTTATLTITGADTNDAANYRCVITNPSGSVNSNQAALTIKTATSISAQPSAQSICAGSTATFSVTAAGDGALTYQWQKNSANLTEEGHYSGVTTATLTVTPADTNDTGNYRCVVTGGCGSATSNTGALSLKTATAVTAQPTDANVCPAANVNFTVTATGDGTVTYQWLKDDMYMSNGGHYSGVTTATLTITGADTNDAAYYACLVSANCGNDTSNEALLTIKAVTAITTHPSNATISGGQSANFIVAATGDGTLTYQWQKNSVNQANGGHYSGCTTATLTVSSADTNDAANYRCVVTAGCGSATSNQATLTVNVCTAPTLTNGNFEYSTVGNPPYGWTTYIQASKSGAWTIQTATPPQGTRWQQTQVYNTGAFGGVRQNVTGLTSGNVYTISGTYKTNSVSATAAVRYNLAGNTDRANSTVLVSKTATSWGTFSADVTATGASMMLFLDHQNGSSSNKAGAFDNIKVVCK